MITQQEIVDRLNQLTLRYNITWYDIRFDADKAIHKINNYLGTKYPKMSSILLSPDSTYSLGSVISEDSVTLYEIFPEDYIHSIVIPYIAMELLARDEEFTTVYTKYAAEVEDGLFNMFQNEFNRVPLTFRQNPDAGVFFPSDSPQGIIQHNKDADLPVFKFKIYYHINNAEIMLTPTTSFTFAEDNNAYLYNDVATIKGFDTQLIAYDGTKTFKFLSWSKGRYAVEHYHTGDTVTMTADVHLYANWEVTNTLTIDALTGAVHIKNAYLQSLTELVIPDAIDGIVVTRIPTLFLHLSGSDGYGDSSTYSTSLQKIVLPKYLTHIDPRAFFRFTGDSIIIPETPLTVNYTGINMAYWAFDFCPSLKSIIIPTNVVAMEANTFPSTHGVDGKSMTIYCRILERNQAWHVDWATPSDVTKHYAVDVRWGYNG